MGFKSLNLDSVVTDVTTEVKASLKIDITYADNTRKVSQFAVGDTIAIKFIENERLSTVIGNVSKINTTGSDVYFLMDTSVTYESYIKKIYPSQVRDLSNITSPSFDISYDAQGNIIPPDTTNSSTTSTSTTSGDSTTGTTTNNTTSTTSTGTTTTDTSTTSTTTTSGDSSSTTTSSTV